MKIDWAISIGSVALLWLMGNKWKYAPLFGVFVQILWFWYVFETKHWGLLAGVIAYTLVHFRNAIKWLK